MTKAPRGLNKVPRGIDQSSAEPVFSARPWLNKDRRGPEQIIFGGSVIKGLNYYYEIKIWSRLSLQDRSSISGPPSFKRIECPVKSTIMVHLGPKLGHITLLDNLKNVKTFYLALFILLHFHVFFIAWLKTPNKKSEIASKTHHGVTVNLV